MGNIPLPALAVKPPEVPDYIGQMGKLLALKSMSQQQQLQQQQMKENDITLQQKQLQMQNIQKAQAAFTASKGDPDSYLSNLQQSGVTPDFYYNARQAMLKDKQAVATLDKDQLDNQSKRNQFTLQGIQSMLATQDPVQKQQLYTNFISQAKSQKLLPDDVIANLPPQVPSDDVLKTQMYGVMTHEQYLNQAKFAAELQDKGASAYGKSMEMMAQTLGSAKSQQDWDQGFKALKAAGVPSEILAQVGPTFSPENAQRAMMFGISPDKLYSIPVEKLGLNAYLAAHPGQTAWDYQKALKSFVPMLSINLQKNMLSDNALDAAAENYAFTNQMPPGVFRAPGMVSQIINRAAELHPNLDLSHNKAVYDSAVNALKDTEKKATFLDAFERTAQKNMQQFIDAGSKIINTDSPLLNKGLNAWNRNVISSPERNAYDAAYGVAIPEIARVLNNMGNAGVLSDEARKEAKVLIDQNASFKSRLAAAKIIMQDFKNRRDSFDMVLDDLRSRTRDRGGESADPRDRVNGGTNAPEQKTQTNPDDLSSYSVWNPNK